MDIFADLMMGLSVAISPINILYLLIGAIVGMIVGVIPGFGPSAGLAILLPVTFGIDAVDAPSSSDIEMCHGGFTTATRREREHPWRKISSLALIWQRTFSNCTAHAEMGKFCFARS